uniref:AFG3-like protein 1 isoform X1 n=1 Tax=Halichoerus grypus TaxID=9711 RepID=UPI001659D37E|nr:AFG3-like protein 1 isoform X1 [Halichoerus grypus]
MARTGVRAPAGTARQTEEGGHARTGEVVTICFTGTSEPKDAGPGADRGKRGGKQSDFAWWRRMQKMPFLLRTGSGFTARRGGMREFPWDDEDCCSLAVLGAGVAMGFFYVWILGRKSPGSTSCSVPWRAV